MRWSGWVVDKVTRVPHPRQSEEGERPLNAMAAVDSPGALFASAAASTARWASGKPLGPLDGVRANEEPLPTSSLL